MSGRVTLPAAPVAVNEVVGRRGESRLLAQPSKTRLKCSLRLRSLPSAYTNDREIRLDIVGDVAGEHALPFHW